MDGWLGGWADEWISMSRWMDKWQMGILILLDIFLSQPLWDIIWDTPNPFWTMTASAVLAFLKSWDQGPQQGLACAINMSWSHAMSSVLCFQSFMVIFVLRESPCFPPSTWAGNHLPGTAWAGISILPSTVSFQQCAFSISRHLQNFYIDFRTQRVFMTQDRD